MESLLLRSSYESTTTHQRKWGDMSKGIFTAVSGAIAQTAKLDTIANNLANVDTPAFKRDSQLFREYLTSYKREPTAIEVPRVPASIESFYDMQGGDRSFVDLDGTNKRIETRCSRNTKSTKHSIGMPFRTRFSCIACRRSAAKKSPTRWQNTPIRPCSGRVKIVCTYRKR